MNTHRRPAPVHVLEFSRELAQRLRVEWTLAESPNHSLRLISVVVPFVPPEEPPPPAGAQRWAA